jgi:hypothetical protein
MTYEQAQKAAIARYPVYTKLRPGPEGEVDCKLTKALKVSAQKAYAKKLMKNAQPQA